MTIIKPKYLIIGPRFFSYGDLIAKRLEELGCPALFVNERRGISLFEKAILRFLGPKFVPKLQVRLIRYLKKIDLTEVQKVLLLATEVVTPEFFKQIKHLLPKAVFISYSWDSIRNKPNAIKIAHLADKALSFDSEDVKLFSHIILRPLFYHPWFEKKMITQHQNSKLVVGFLGSLHSDRMLVLSKILKELQKFENVQTKCFIYCQSKFIFYLRLILSPRIWRIKNLISYSSMNLEEVSKWFDNVNIVIDIHHPKQTGLTMRTVEAIGMGKSLITTNQNISHYKFYDTSIHYIVDRYLPEIDNFININDNTANLKYLDARAELSMDSWIMSVFST
jgi:hypothetical protein